MATSRPIQGVARAADPAVLQAGTAGGGAIAAAADDRDSGDHAGGRPPGTRGGASGGLCGAGSGGGTWSCHPARRDSERASSDAGAARRDTGCRSWELPGLGVAPGPGARPETPAVAEHALPALRGPGAAAGGPPPITHGPDRGGRPA